MVENGSASGPLVGVVMGSDSDWQVMEEAAKALDEFGVRYEADVVSAQPARSGANSAPDAKMRPSFDMFPA